MKYKAPLVIAGTLMIASGGALAGVVDTTITFDNGMEGFTASSGLNSIVPDGPHDGSYYNVVNESFGVEFRTDRNENFLGDYTQHDSITLSIDLQIDQITFFGQPTERSLVVELRNHRYSSGIFQYGSAFIVLDRTLSSANNSDWSTYSVTFDPTSTDLPMGWTGYGGSDDADGPVLPDGATFADVLRNVDEVVFGTLVPLERYPFTNFDISVDNISISTVPAPSSLALLGMTGLVGTRRRRSM